MILGCILEIFGTFWVVTHLKDSDGTNWFGFFTVFDIGCWCVPHVNQHRFLLPMLLPWFFQEDSGLQFSSPVGGFAGGWPSPTEGLAAWARAATSAALSRTAGASHAGSCTQHAGRSSSEVHGEKRKKMKVWWKYRKKHQWFFSDWCRILMPYRKFETWQGFRKEIKNPIHARQGWLVSFCDRSPGTPPKTNMTGWKIHHGLFEPMYFLLKMRIFQPVMLVFRSVLLRLSWLLVLVSLKTPKDNLMAAGLQRRVGVSLAAGRQSQCLLQEDLPAQWMWVIGLRGGEKRWKTSHGFMDCKAFRSKTPWKFNILNPNSHGVFIFFSDDFPLQLRDFFGSTC